MHRYAYSNLYINMLCICVDRSLACIICIYSNIIYVYGFSMRLGGPWGNSILPPFPSQVFQYGCRRFGGSSTSPYLHIFLCSAPPESQLLASSACLTIFDFRFLNLAFTVFSFSYTTTRQENNSRRARKILLTSFFAWPKLEAAFVLKWAFDFDFTLISENLLLTVSNCA